MSEEIAIGGPAYCETCRMEIFPDNCCECPKPAPQPAQPVCEKCGQPRVFSNGYFNVMLPCQCEHLIEAPQPAGGAGEKLGPDTDVSLWIPAILNELFPNAQAGDQFDLDAILTAIRKPCARCAELERDMGSLLSRSISLQAKVADLERERDEARQQAHYIAEGTVIPQLDQLIQKYQAISQSGWTLARTRNERINALEAKRDTLQARVSEMEKDASALMTSMNEASRFTLELEKKQAARISKLETALREIASKSRCECWDVPGMGSGLSPKWKGCAAHNSDDPEEWCLCCIATAALGEKEAGEKKTP